MLSCSLGGFGCFLVLVVWILLAWIPHNAIFKKYMCVRLLRVFSLSACGQVAAHKDKVSKQAEMLNGRIILGCP